MKKILHNPIYIWVLVADLLSNFGDMVYYLALLNYVLMIPNSKLALAIVTFSEIFPTFMGLFAGYWADRTASKLPTIKLTLLFRLVLYLLLGICMGFEPSLWIVVLAASINVLSDAAGNYENGLYAPLSLRVVRDEERESYIAFRGTVTSSLNIAFQGLSALLVGLLSYSQLAFLNAGTFFIALLIMQHLTPAFQELLAERPLKMAEQPSQTGQGPSLLSSLKIALDELKKVAEFRVLLVVGPAVNACFSALTPLVILLMSEDSHFVLYNTETTLAAIMLTIFLGTILGGLSVLYVFKETSMVQLAVGAVVCLTGIYTGLLLHNLPLVLICTTLTGIASGAVNPKFGAKLANSMPEEHLATISGGVSTYFMVGMSLVQLLVAGLVLILSSHQLSLIFLLLSLGLLAYSLLTIRKLRSGF